MLDIKRIREDYEGVKAGVERRTKGSFGIEKIPALDEKDERFWRKWKR